MRLGIDLGGTNIAAGLVDDAGRILAKSSRKTLPERGLDAMAEDMAALGGELCAQSGTALSSLRSAGIGSPGSIDPERGVVIYAGNLGFRQTPLAAALQQRLGVPVRLGNDANVAALGEYHAMEDKNADSMILVTLGTGVGGGVILGGRIHTGFNACAGEVGHMVTHAGGEDCTCGRKGCWEAYASATALVRMTKKAMEQHPQSQMHAIAAEYGKISGRTAFTAARKGDEAGEAVVAAYLRELAAGIVNLINLFQPARLCIGGGISGEGDYLLDRLRPLAEAECFAVGDKRCTLSLAKLGNDAGIIGAAML